MGLLCIVAAGKTTAVAASLFTLAWTHSVERTSWQETWRVAPDGLVAVEARVKGSGAGMEPPDGARLEHGWWVYVPTLPPRPELALAASGATFSGWRLCAGRLCHELGAEPGEPVVLRPCGAGVPAGPG